MQAGKDLERLSVVFELQVARKEPVSPRNVPVLCPSLLGYYLGQLKETIA